MQAERATRSTRKALSDVIYHWISVNWGTLKNQVLGRTHKQRELSETTEIQFINYVSPDTGSSFDGGGGSFAMWTHTNVWRAAMMHP